MSKGYGTFSESSSNNARENHPQLEEGEKYHKGPTTRISPLPTASLITKNSGSTARDNFSIERNFLAWLRLSMTLIVVGVAYFLHCELFELPNSNHYHYGFLGLILVSLGVLALFWSLWSYIQFQLMLDKKAVHVENDTSHFVIASLIGITALTGFILQR